jgi:hypothetical protein
MEIRVDSVDRAASIVGERGVAYSVKDDLLLLTIEETETTQIIAA